MLSERSLRQRVHTVRLHLYEVLMQAKLIYEICEKSENTMVMGGNWNGARGNFINDNNLLYFDRNLGYTGVYISQTL